MIYLPIAWWLAYRALRRGRRHPLLSERQCRCRIWATAIGCCLAVFGAWYPFGIAFGWLVALLTGIPLDWNYPISRIGDRQLLLIFGGVGFGFVVAEITGLLALRRLLRWLIPELDANS